MLTKHINVDGAASDFRVVTDQSRVVNVLDDQWTVEKCGNAVGMKRMGNNAIRSLIEM